MSRIPSLVLAQNDLQIDYVALGSAFTGLCGLQIEVLPFFTSFLTQYTQSDKIPQNRAYPKNMCQMDDLQQKLRHMAQFSQTKYEPAISRNSNQKQKQMDNTQSLSNNYLFNSKIFYEYREDGNYNDVTLKLLNEVSLVYFKKQIFQDIQIENTNLTIKTSWIFDLLSGWCNEMAQIFQIQHYFYRSSENVFLSSCKKQNNLEHWMKKQLDEEKQVQSKNLKEYLTKIKHHYYQKIKQALKKYSLDSGYNYHYHSYNYEESCTKLIISIYESATQYILKYLNRLLHGLLAVSYRFFNRQQLSKAAWPQPPCLIPCKFHNIQKRYKGGIYDNKFEMIKNMNDIQIFKSQTDGRHFYQINLSTNNSTLVYDKIFRSRFGCLAELSKIAYTEKKLYLENRFFAKLYLAEKIDSSNYEQPSERIKRDLSEEIQNNLGSQVQKSNQQFPESGLFFMRSKQPNKKIIPYNFKIYVNGKKKYFFVKNKGELSKLSVLEDQYLRLKFLHENHIYALKNSEAIQISEEQIQKKFILPQYVQQCRLKSKETISLVNHKLSDQECEDILTAGKGFSSIKPHNFTNVYGHNSSKQITKNLFLTDNNITNVREIAQVYPAMEWLQLNRTQMKDYSNINKMQNLRILILDQCKMTTLDSSICNLPKLQVITISESQIENIPASISKTWKKIKHVQFDYNNISDFEPLTSCTTLTTLNLNGNKITNIPENIKKLQSLQKLFLGQNKIQNFCNAVYEIKSLKQLHLHKNLLKKIPQGIQSLKQISILNISENNLEQLPEDIKQLKTLNELYASKNSLIKLSEGLNNLENISICDFSDNKTLEKVECSKWIQSNGTKETKQQICKLVEKQ